jgi:hypothetical protein
MVGQFRRPVVLPCRAAGVWGPGLPAAHWDTTMRLRRAHPACARGRRSHAILRTFPRSQTIGKVFCEAETSLRQRQPTDFCVRQIRLPGHRNARRVQAAIFIRMHCCPPSRHHPPEMHYIHAMPSEEYAIGYRRFDFPTFLTCVASICARCGRIVGSPPSTAHLYRKI